MRRIGFLAFGCALALVACGDGGSRTTAPEPSQARVTIAAIAFEPPAIEVARGDSVVWANEDESVEHTITSGRPGDRGVPGLDNAKPDRPDGIFDGTVADAGDTFEFTFDELGTFEYFCRVHPVMTGSVIVSD